MSYTKIKLKSGPSNRFSTNLGNGSREPVWSTDNDYNRLFITNSVASSPTLVNPVVRYHEREKEGFPWNTMVMTEGYEGDFLSFPMITSRNVSSFGVCDFLKGYIFYRDYIGIDFTNPGNDTWNSYELSYSGTIVSTDTILDNAVRITNLQNATIEDVFTHVSDGTGYLEIVCVTNLGKYYSARLYPGIYEHDFGNEILKTNITSTEKGKDCMEVSFSGSLLHRTRTLYGRTSFFSGGYTQGDYYLNRTDNFYEIRSGREYYINSLEENVLIGGRDSFGTITFSVPYRALGSDSRSVTLIPNPVGFEANTENPWIEDNPVCVLPSVSGILAVFEQGTKGQAYSDRIVLGDPVRKRLDFIQSVPLDKSVLVCTPNNGRYNYDWVNFDFIKTTRNVTYAQLSTIVSGGTLVKGQKYRITDYATTTATANTSAAGHAFDLVVTATSESTLDSMAQAVNHIPAQGETDYFAIAGADLTKWQVWYDIDNDTTKYAWAKTTANGGKGVIYRMVDEFGNDCPYDFKNIMFTVSGQQADAYTFNVYANSACTDHSLNGGRCYGNVMKPYYVSGVQTLNFNVFYNTSDTAACYSNTFLDSCNSNTFGNNCYSNTFGNSCNSNTFGNNCNNNNFGNNCHSNTFVNDCYSNTFGNSCYSNTFGNVCNYNTFENNCYSNTFGNSCGSNTFRNYCYSNTFGNNCHTNTFGDYCDSNTFDNYCQHNTLGNVCGANTFGDYCDYNTFGDGCNHIVFGDSSNPPAGGDYCRYNIMENGNRYIRLYNIGTASSNEQLQNVYIAQGVSGTLQNYVEISTIARNLTYRTTVAVEPGKPTPANPPRIYCEDEIIQADWDQTTSTAPDYIKNKPSNITNVQTDWEEDDSSDDSYLVNMPGVFRDPWNNTEGFTTNVPDGTVILDVAQDIDGNSYNGVVMDNKIWLKENLRVTHKPNGDPITIYYHANGDSSNDETYGLLYNWGTMMNGESSSDTVPSGVQGIAPDGWHIPSDAEWTAFTNYIGSKQEYILNNDSTYIAKALASKEGWDTSTTDYTPGKNPENNNLTNFSALPAGFNTNSSYFYFGKKEFFWSATEHDNDGVDYRVLDYNLATVSTGSSEDYRFSVRCICNTSASDWFAANRGRLYLKLTLTGMVWSQISAVAESGSYNDLSDTPALTSVVVKEWTVI